MEGGREGEGGKEYNYTRVCLWKLMFRLSTNALCNR